MSRGCTVIPGSVHNLMGSLFQLDTEVSSNDLLLSASIKVSEDISQKYGCYLYFTTL